MLLTGLFEDQSRKRSLLIFQWFWHGLWVTCIWTCV